MPQLSTSPTSSNNLSALPGLILRRTARSVSKETLHLQNTPPILRDSAGALPQDEVVGVERLVCAVSISASVRCPNPAPHLPAPTTFPHSPDLILRRTERSVSKETPHLPSTPPILRDSVDALPQDEVVGGEKACVRGFHFSVSKIPQPSTSPISRISLSAPRASSLHVVFGPFVLPFGDPVS